MKIIIILMIFSINLVFSGNSLAAKHDSANGTDTFQPAQPDDIIASYDNYSEKENLEAILQKLKDPDPFIRVEAVQSLGEIRIEQSLVSVCQCLNDENLYVRAYAAEALGKIGEVNISLALLSLLAAMDDPSPYVRSMIIAALGELQDDRAVDSLRKLLLDEDKSVRRMAAWALKNIEESQ